MCSKSYLFPQSVNQYSHCRIIATHCVVCNIEIMETPIRKRLLAMLDKSLLLQLRFFKWCCNIMWHHHFLGSWLETMTRRPPSIQFTFFAWLKLPPFFFAPCIHSSKSLYFSVNQFWQIFQIVSDEMELNARLLFASVVLIISINH